MISPVRTPCRRDVGLEVALAGIELVAAMALVRLEKRQLVFVPRETKKGFDRAEIPKMAAVSKAFAVYHPSSTSAEGQT